MAEELEKERRWLSKPADASAIPEEIPV